MRAGQILKIASEMGVDTKWALNCRKRFLAGKVFERQMDFEYWINRDDEDTETAKMFLVFAIREVEAIANLKREIRYLDAALTRVHDNDITPDMIDRARQHPIEQVITFDRTGKALAWCHDDRNPSLTWDRKRNRAKCWPCDKSFDTIAVLMERDNLTFRDAVRRLA